MDSSSYRQTVESMKKWYAEHAALNRTLFYSTRVTVLILAAAAPIFAAIDFKFAAVITGALVAIITGFYNLGRFDQQWVRYRSTAELLRRECRRFDAMLQPYDGSDRVHVFGRRVEAVIDGELNQWVQLIGKLQEKNGKDTA